MSDWRKELLGLLEEAKDLVRKNGEGRYICDGLALAQEIVKADHDADIDKLVKDFFDDGWG